VPAISAAADQFDTRSGVPDTVAASHGPFG
jgi:hypothetical protein